MAKTQFQDSAGRTAYKDDQGNVFTENGSNPTYMNVDEWNKRQANRWGSGSSSNITPMGVPDFGINPQFQTAVSGALQMQQQANQPAIQRYEQSIPQIQDIYSGERERLQGQIAPLDKRYQDIINSIKGQQSVAEQRTSTATARELGRRGISTQSGLGEQMTNESLLPVSAAFSGDIANAGLAQTQGVQGIQNAIAGLAGDEAGQVGQILNTIAGLKSYDPSSAISTAMQLGNYQRAGQTSANPTRDLFSRYLDIMASRGQGTEQAGAPQYSPATGEGTISQDGKYIFRGGQWVARSGQDLQNEELFQGFDKIFQSVGQ